MPGMDHSDVVLPDDLERALTSRVESGQFPSRSAVVEAALRVFLAESTGQEAPQNEPATESRAERLPSPFILDEWVHGPGDIPRRPGRDVGCVFLHGEKRLPDRYPGE